MRISAGLRNLVYPAVSRKDNHRSNDAYFQPSSPAKAGDPVFQSVSDRSKGRGVLRFRGAWRPTTDVAAQAYAGLLAANDENLRDFGKSERQAVAAPARGTRASANTSGPNFTWA